MATSSLFEINGNQYKVTPHQTTEMGPLAFKLGALITGPLLSLVKSQTNSGASSMGDINLQDIDSTEVQSCLIEVTKHVTPSDLRMIFNRTTRNGKHLSQDMCYDEAYQGNWSEWYQALYQILKCNGFFDFLSSLEKTTKGPEVPAKVE